MTMLLLSLFSGLASVAAWCALAGIAVMAGATPFAASACATFAVLAPAIFVAISSRRLFGTLLTMTVWSVGLFVCVGVWAPERRNDAVRLVIHNGLANAASPRMEALAQETLSRALPTPPDPNVVAVDTIAEPITAPVGPPLTSRDIALPYEGEGRRLTVPVVFRHQGREVETNMMLDTGATYTTLPSAILRQLGALPPRDAPVLTLTTANGERRAPVTLIDQVWLGDIAVANVAVTVCEDCAGSVSAGLLGLNVANGFNVTIDADRREVVFRQRERFDRVLDVRPFAEISGRFTRFPGDRTEAIIDLVNTSDQPIGRATARVSCEAGEWDLALGAIEARDQVRVRRRLPGSADCPQWTLALIRADWAVDVPSP